MSDHYYGTPASGYTEAETLAEVEDLRDGEPGEHFTVEVPGRDPIVFSHSWGRYIAEGFDGGSPYIEADTAKEIVEAIYSGTRTAAVQAAQRVMGALAKGQTPSLVDHITLGTHTALMSRKALNLPGGAGAVPDTQNLPDPDLVPRTTKPGVKPPPSADPLDPQGEVVEDAQTRLPSTSDVQAMRVRVACANPGLSAKEVDDLVHDALVLAWRD